MMMLGLTEGFNYAASTHEKFK